MTSTASAKVRPTSNVGPLPSTTPPAECARLGLSERYAAAVYSSTTTSYLELRRNFANVYSTEHTTVTCLPASYWEAVQDARSPVFSPATACPYGYAPRCTFVATGATLTAGPTVRFWPALSSGDTAIGCCPSGYMCAEETNSYSCVSTLALGETSEVINLSNVTQVTQIHADAQTTASIFAINLIYIPEKATQTTPPKQNDTVPFEKHVRKGLSVGQTAAIGVCVSLAAIALLIGLLFFVRRRNNKRTAKAAQSEDITAHTYRKSELDGFSRPRLELDASETPLDSGSNARLSELPTALPGAERQHILQHGAVELPGSDISPTASPPGRQSPAMRRKPVTGRQTSLVDENFSLVGSKISDRGSDMAKDGPVVS
ncbi:hypothetical protein PWT90_10983 [Aphanocladium album]|nr:hypothetical protein PWT90_10983 [Aphanocladium album]